MYIVYSDLDGTLLDHNKYDFNEAQEGLKILNDKKILLILCSSKTRSEIEDIRIRLINNAPFIVENGGAVFIPVNFFENPVKNALLIDDYYCIEIGFKYNIIREKFQELKNIVSCPMQGFSDMTLEEISNLTNLPIKDAEKASKREYSEPFIIEDNAEIKKVEQALADTPFLLTKGARFFHLTGPSDKGKAVRTLTEIFQENYNDESIMTVGIGDSKNDLSMLENVTFPCMVKKINGEFNEDIILANTIFGEGIGPNGWNKIIKSLFSD